MDSNTVISEFDSLSMPFSLEAEQAVLGSILIDPPCLTTVMDCIKAEHFYLPQHKAIFSILVNIDAVGGKIDPLIVLEALKKENIYDEAGGKTYLFQLSQSVPSTANVETYAKIIREKFYIRTLITAAREIEESAVAQEDTADLLLDNAEQKIYNIRQGKSTSGPAQIGDIIVNEVYDRLQKLNSPDREKYIGFPTGFSDLDKTISGLNNSDLIIIGARPAMGKTSFALNLARNVALLAKRKVLFFSLEMTKAQLAQRVLSSEANVDSMKMRSGELSEDEWVRIGTATSVLNDCPLYFDDTSNITVPEMKARIRRMKDVECVIIDYLQLMKSGTRVESRVQEVSEITRGLKLMAKDLNIPVITCAQLARGTEGRGKSHRPQLADLRESGSIEQDADIVMMLYRPDYYKEGDETPPDDTDDEHIPNLTQLIVCKNRHGPVHDVNLIFNPDNTRFTSMEKMRNDM